jgi:hypothetical protein
VGAVELSAFHVTKRGEITPLVHTASIRKFEYPVRYYCAELYEILVAVTFGSG